MRTTVAPGVWRDDGPARPFAMDRVAVSDAGVPATPRKQYAKCPETGCELMHPRVKLLGCKLHPLGED